MYQRVWQTWDLVTCTPVTRQLHCLLGWQMLLLCMGEGKKPFLLGGRGGGVMATAENAVRNESFFFIGKKLTRLGKKILNHRNMVRSKRSPKTQRKSPKKSSATSRGSKRRALSRQRMRLKGYHATRYTAVSEYDYVKHDLEKLAPDGVKVVRVQNGVQVVDVQNGVQGEYRGRRSYDVVLSFDDRQMTVKVTSPGIMQWVGGNDVLRNAIKERMYEAPGQWVTQIDFATQLKHDIKKGRGDAAEWVQKNAGVLKEKNLELDLAHLLFEPDGLLNPTRKRKRDTSES